MSEVQIDIKNFDPEDFSYTVTYKGKWYAGYPLKRELLGASEPGLSGEGLAQKAKLGATQPSTAVGENAKIPDPLEARTLGLVAL
jgi:hypothetical protein